MLDPKCRLLIASALHFAGTWMARFDPDATCDAPFYCANGQTRTVPLMRATRRLQCMQADGMKAVALPYANPRFSMYVLMHEDGPRALAAQLDSQRWVAWKRTFHEVQEGLVAMPRIELRCLRDMQEVLIAAGLAELFSDEADFSNASADKPLKVDKALQELYLRVDEQGAVAGVAYTFSLMLSAPSIEFRMIVDRPYLFLITDDVTDSVLLLGIVDDPQPMRTRAAG